MVAQRDGTSNKAKPVGFWRNIRRQFLAGALVFIPVAIAVFILNWAFRIIDDILQPVIAIIFGHRITGLGLVATIILIFLIGLATSNYIGRKIVQLGEWIITRIPIVSDLYLSSKQALEVMSGFKESKFKEVVLVEYPRLGTYTIAFVTNEIEYENNEKAYVVLIPHSPNPITGFMQLFSENQIIHTQMTVRQALTMTVSGGLASPSKIIRHSTVEQQCSPDLTPDPK